MNSNPHRIPETSDDIIELYISCIQYHGQNTKECLSIEKKYMEIVKKEYDEKREKMKIELENEKK